MIRQLYKIQARRQLLKALVIIVKDRHIFYVFVQHVGQGFHYLLCTKKLHIIA